MLGHGDVELEHVDALAELAGGALGELERPPGAGEHDLRPSSMAILATPNASEASVITPVITIFLPSSSPMPGT